MSETKIFAVTGNPVLHSKSPVIHNAMFKASGMDRIYTRLAASSAKEALDTAREIGISGLNVTSPFKEEIMPYLGEMGEDVRRIGAANTVILENGKPRGHNTDWIGVAEALLRNRVELENKKAVVLGAGGAGASAAFGLLASGASVVMLNRSFGRAREAASKLGCRCAPLEKFGEELKNADVFVSAISARERVVNPKFLKKGLAVLDANYPNSVLAADAKKAGCKTVDGAEWLLYQALPAFELFTGKRADGKAAGKALRSAKPKRKPNVALIGFMGAGKSTTGKIIAKKLKAEFVDIDEAIEKNAKMPIREIFAKIGEAGFRKMESKAVKRHIAKSSGKVFSCGGGIILSRANRKIISEKCVAVWLWASPEIAVGRAMGNGDRPLLANAKDKVAKAKGLIEERISLYAQTADMIISTNNRSPEEAAERIVYEINNAFRN